MNNDRIQGSWKYFKGCIKAQWAMLIDDQAGLLAARRDQIAGRMQRTYGRIKENSARQLHEWRARMKQTHRIA